MKLQFEEGDNYLPCDKQSTNGTHGINLITRFGIDNRNRDTHWNCIEVHGNRPELRDGLLELLKLNEEFQLVKLNAESNSK